MRTVVALACVWAIVWSASPAAGGESDEPFTGSVSGIDRDTRRLMVGSSWHAGCPTPLRDLRIVRVTYRGFDGAPHHGRLAVHRRWADEILAVFRRLYRSGFPIRRVRLVDRFDADDRASMRHDNTSSFNCRYVAGTTTWSQHAYGRAVDINPVENPYVVGSNVSPGRGRRYLDRTDVRPGMIVPHEVVVRVFRRIGWGWGGRWTSAKDYQHFSANGRLRRPDGGPALPVRTSRGPPGVECHLAWHDDEAPPSSSRRCGGRIPGRSSGEHSARWSAPRP